MSETYRVRVTDFVFCSAHFITFNGGKCETLHGHNYRAAVEVEAPLNAEWYAVDFVALRRITSTVTAELDHKMLIAGRSQVVVAEVSATAVKLTHGERVWLFPRGDCIVLDVEATTAELLAKTIAGRVTAGLSEEFGLTPQRLTVEVEESPGQGAWYEWRPKLS
jgi:6-pyruvoyltetrahydropterin/6-carboxytetrahydropterin synthase